MEKAGSCLAVAEGESDQLHSDGHHMQYLVQEEEDKARERKQIKTAAAIYVHVVCSQSYLGQRGLSPAGGAHERESFAGGDGDGHRPQDLVVRPRGVREPDLRGAMSFRGHAARCFVAGSCGAMSCLLRGDAMR